MQEEGGSLRVVAGYIWDAAGLTARGLVLQGLAVLLHIISWLRGAKT